MKNKKIIHREYDEEITISKTCDICQTTYMGNSDNWGSSSTSYAVLETTMSMRVGVSFPDNQHGEEIRFDICPKCFEDKVIPMLKSIGAEPTVSEWEY